MSETKHKLSKQSILWNSKNPSVDTLQRMITQLQRECYGYKLEVQELKKQRNIVRQLSKKNQTDLCEICYVAPKNVHLSCGHKMCHTCFQHINTLSDNCPYDRQKYDFVKCTTCNSTLCGYDTDEF